MLLQIVEYKGAKGSWRTPRYAAKVVNSTGRKPYLTKQGARTKEPGKVNSFDSAANAKAHFIGLGHEVRACVTEDTQRRAKARTRLNHYR